MLEEINKTFQEITGSRLNNVSQLKLFNILNDIQDNTKLLNIFKAYNISGDIDVSVHFDLYEVSHNDGWENISYEYYGTPYLGWIIALMNKVVNPLEYLEEGMTLSILKPKYIYQLLKEIRNIGNL